MNNPFAISDRELFSNFGKIFFIHNNKYVNSSAYEIHENAVIEIEIPRTLSAKSVKLEIIDAKRDQTIISFDFKWKKLFFDSDVYCAKIPLYRLGKGIYWLKFIFQTAMGEVFGYNLNGKICYSRSKSTKPFQFTVSEFKFNAPNEQYGGVIYHIFVDRFFRAKETEPKINSKLITDWYAPIPEFPIYPGAPINNKYFYGGNLWGIADKLDYIKSLGTTILYLSPIFESPSNHKYDTADYMHVDSAFGGDKALENLIYQAKKKNISVILDGVFNHTGDDSIYFNKYGNYSESGAYQDKGSMYYPWYTFTSYPQKYEAWWGIEILPKINTDLPECRNYFIGEGGVIEKYAKMGILGLRLDVADELSDSFIEAIKEKLCKINKNSVLYGEVWEDASNKVAYQKLKSYYLGTELDGVMNYPLREGIIDFLKNKKSDKLRYALTEVTFNAPKRIRDAQMNILGTHDTERILTVLGGESPQGKSNAFLATATLDENQYKDGRRRLLLAITAIFTLPGIPAIFYGDEVGLQGYGDPFNRRTFPWDNIDHEILAYYQKISKIRRENKVYRTGDFKLIYLTDEILIFERTDKYNSFITVINNTEHDLKIKFSRKSQSIMDMKQADVFKIRSRSPMIIKAKRNTQFEI